MSFSRNIIYPLILGLGLVTAKPLEELPQVDQVKFRNHFRASVEALQKKDYFDAILEANDAIAIYGESPAPYEVLTSIYINLSMYSRAIETGERAVELQETPKLSAYFNLAEVYFVNDMYEKALSMFDKALAITPEKKYYQDHVLVNLIRFKQLISFQKLGDDAGYSNAVSKISEDEDNPLPLMSKVLSTIIDGDHKASAEFLARAKRIYREEIALYEDAMNESGFNTLRVQSQLDDNLEQLKTL